MFLYWGMGTLVLLRITSTSELIVVSRSPIISSLPLAFLKDEDADLSMSGVVGRNCPMVRCGLSVSPVLTNLVLVLSWVVLGRS